MKTSRCTKDDGVCAFFIVGSTCSGKTAVAQRLAENLGFDILSADSMLVYKGMDIGTAKPSPAERSRARYHGIDVVEPGEPFSAAMYRELALDALLQADSNGRAVIVAGGTGLYIRSLIDGLSPHAPADPVLRREAKQVLREQGVAGLQEWLRRENSEILDSLPDKMNPRRLVRALEMERAGVARRERQWRSAAELPPIPGLRFPREQLLARIEKRARDMFEGGLLDEVERLLESRFDSAPTARQAIGYAEAVDCIRGILGVEEAIERTIVRTRQLAKRQNTWFRRQANVEWLECDESMTIADMAAMVEEHWTSHGPTPINASNAVDKRAAIQ